MWYDLIIVAILLFAAYRGLQRGVVYQLATIASVVLCFIFAEAISAAAAPHVPLEPPLNHWVVLVGAYIAFSFVSFAVARMLDGFLEKVKMKEFNRHLGAAFGAVKGLAFCLVITFFAVTMSDKAREALKESKSAYYAAVIMDRIHPVMPEKLQGALDRYLAYFDKSKIQRPIGGENGFGSGVATGNDDFLGDLGELGEIGNQGGSNADNGFGTWDPLLNTSTGGNNVNTGTPSSGGPVMAPPDQTNPFQTLPNGPGTTTPPASQTLTIDDVIQSLPYAISGELDRLVRSGLGQARSQEQLQAMGQQLAKTPPIAYGDLARSWLAGNLPTGTSPSTTTPSNPNNNDLIGNIAGSLYDRATGSQPAGNQPNPTRDMVKDIANGLWNSQFNNQSQPTSQTSDANTMLRNVAGYYAQTVGGSASGYETSIRKQLAGLSQQTVEAVLADWQRDLTGRGLDPDPGTNRDTLLSTRIQRVTQRIGAQPAGTPF